MAISFKDKVVIITGPGGGLKVHVGKPEIGIAAGQAKLAQADIAAPVHHAAGGLGRQLVRGIAERHQIRGLECHGRGTSWNLDCYP